MLDAMYDFIIPISKLATRRRKKPNTHHSKRVANFAATHANTKICNTFANDYYTIDNFKCTNFELIIK